ncbi:MAG: hypothetical protein E2600_07275 [Chryseobacterium sp.]|nr:hypothetical protein [Chryseobacterium sp.]
MKKKINIKYQLLACTLIFSAGKTLAQTGVGTIDPQAAFHIDAAKDASDTPMHIANDVVVTAAGNLGVGLLSPVTRVDLRSADQKGILGVGTNTQTATAAGAGAIRYIKDDPSTVPVEGGYLEYSDGTNWIALPLNPPTKVLINATNNSGVGIPSGISTPITSGWNETGDSENAFTNGVFTAPRDGFYLVSFSITLGPSNGNIPNNTFIETAIEGVALTGTTTIPTFRTINSYPAYQANVKQNYISGNCNAIFNLKTGNSFRFSVKHTMGAGRVVLADPTLNNLSISEL